MKKEEIDTEREKQRRSKRMIEKDRNKEGARE